MQATRRLYDRIVSGQVEPLARERDRILRGTRRRHPFTGRLAVRERQRRSQPGVPLRRHHREHHCKPLATPQTTGHGARFRIPLQGPRSQSSSHRPGAGRPSRPPGKNGSTEEHFEHLGGTGGLARRVAPVGRAISPQTVRHFRHPGRNCPGDIGKPPLALDRRRKEAHDQALHGEHRSLSTLL